MDKQNVTLVVPKDILRKAKILAIERDTSLSGLLTQALTEIVTRSDQYQAAKENHLDWLEKDIELGTKGKISWSREELHDRKA